MMGRLSRGPVGPPGGFGSLEMMATLSCRRKWLGALGCVAVCAALGGFMMLPSLRVAHATASQPVYFFSDNSEGIGPRNPLVMRPRGFLLFLDGQWVLQDLRWTGWGSPVARANGISNSSNDIPSAAQGKRINTWAAMTLSDPTRWHGREVYACFHILVPPPASDLGGCVLPNPLAGGGWLLSQSFVDFLSPDRKVWCVLGAEPMPCDAGAGPHPGTSAPAVGASLRANGTVILCSMPAGTQGCTIAGDSGAPILTIGHRVEASNVLCQSERAGIACTIATGRHKGRGFLISGTTVRRL
jgi:hypothetical protein